MAWWPSSVGSSPRTSRRSTSRLAISGWRTSRCRREREELQPQRADVAPVGRGWIQATEKGAARWWAAPCSLVIRGCRATRPPCAFPNRRCTILVQPLRAEPHQIAPREQTFGGQYELTRHAADALVARRLALLLRQAP